MLGILMFCCRVRSLRQLKMVSQSPQFLANWCRLGGATTDSVAHPDTMIYLLKQLDNRQMATILPQMVRHLIRTKRLSGAFLEGYLMVAIDATGIFSSPEFHCKQCLTRHHKDGTVTYMHLMLEAKVISRDGMALSLLSEPIDNPEQGNHDKQDCELKAFKRLATRLKELFPRQKIVLLVDSEYAGAPLFTICNENQWQFICTFKPGSIPTLFEEAMALLGLDKDNAIVSQDNADRNIWRWLDYLPYHVGKHQFRLGFFDYRHIGKDEERYFSWLTSFTPSRENVRKLTKGERRRWKIENEGFNQQKNGYSLEHFCDCSNTNALIGLYLLLQIAHTLMQLLAKSTLVGGYETLTFLADLLLESLRNVALPVYLFAPELPPMQIRFLPP